MADTQFDMQQLVQTQEQLQMLPNDAEGKKLLVKYAGGSDPSIPTWMASAEIARRNKLQETSKSFQQAATKPVMAQWAEQLLYPNQMAVNPAAAPQQTDPTQAQPQVNPAQAQPQVNPAAAPPQVNPAEPVTAAEGGLMSIPVDMYHADSFATGGIVAFDEGKQAAENPDPQNPMQAQPVNPVFGAAMNQMAAIGPQTPGQFAQANRQMFMPAAQPAPAPAAPAPAPARPAQPDTRYATPSYPPSAPTHDAGLKAIEESLKTKEADLKAEERQVAAEERDVKREEKGGKGLTTLPGAAPANNTAQGPALPGSAPTANQGLQFAQQLGAEHFKEKSQADVNKEQREQMKEWGVSQDPFADVMRRQAESEARQKEAQGNYAHDEMMRMFANVGTGNFVQSQRQGLQAAEALKDKHAELIDAHERANIEFAHNMAKEKDALARGNMKDARAAKAAADDSRVKAYELSGKIAANNAQVQTAMTAAAESPSKIKLHEEQARAAGAEAEYRAEIKKGIPSEIALRNAQARKASLEAGELVDTRKQRILDQAISSNSQLRELSKALTALQNTQQGPGTPEYEKNIDEYERVEAAIYKQHNMPYTYRTRAPAPPPPAPKGGWWPFSSSKPNLPAGLPEGARKIGVAKDSGKDVYELPDGKRVVQD